MPRPIHVMILIFLMLSCEEKYEKNRPYSAYPQSAADVVTNQKLPPTNPDGGKIEGKSEAMDPEESQRRKTRNVGQPIVWGESIAGISMTTSFEEAQGILSESVGSSGFFIFYGEHLAVAWSGGEPNVPFAIVALDGYGGAISLPEPFGDIRVGDDISSFFSDDYEANRNTVRALARVFDKEGAGYDCLARQTCRYAEFDNGEKRLEFQRGIIAVDSSNRISLIYTLIPQSFPAPVSGDYVYGETIAGYSLGSTRASTEQELGLPILAASQTNPLDYYDSLNLVFQWGADNLPLSIIIRHHFDGNILIGDSISKRIGDSLIDVLSTPPDTSTVTDEELIDIHVPNLLKTMERLFHDRAIDYDCLSPGQDLDPTCALEVFETSIRLDFPMGSFILNRSANLEVLAASLSIEQEFETAESVPAED